MSRVVIYVGDTLLDLYPETVIAMTFTATNLGDLKSRGASYTNRIAIPKTEANRRLFGYPDNEKSNSSVVYTKLSCRVLVDGVSVPEMNGLYLTDAGSSYECAIYTNEVDIFGGLENVLCSEIDFGVSEILDDTFVTAYKDGTDDFVAAIVDYGKGISLPKLKLDFFYSDKWKVVARPRIAACKLATTGNKTLSGLSAIDGVTPVAGDRILVHLQTTTSENGIYIADSGSWTRAIDFVTIEQALDQGIYVQWGATYSQYWFVQTAISGDFAFTGLIAAGTQEFNWDRPKTAFAYFNGRVPHSNYLELEFEFPKMSNIFGTETWDFSVDWALTIASGTPGVYLKMYLRREDGVLVNVINDFENTTGTKNSTGSVTALARYTHVVFCTYTTTANGGVWPTVEILNTTVITETDIVPNLQAEWNLPCIKFYRAIQEILDSLGSYSLEYPNSDSSYFESLLLTYSREYYGYYDKTVDVDEGDSINLSKFILPDISQKALLMEWLFRTQSLVRVKNGVIEVKPIFNILKDKVTTAVNWTDKRVREQDKISLSNDQFAQTNILEDIDTVDEMQITRDLGQTPGAAISNQGTFTIADTKLPEEKFIYKSIFAASQRTPAVSNCYAFCPVYSWASIDRKDFKFKPKLRIMQGFTGGAFGPAYYYEGTSETGAMYGTYRYLSTTLIGAIWDSFISKSYSNYVSAIQKSKIIERDYMLTAQDIGSLDLFVPVYDDGSYFLIGRISNYIPGRRTKVELLKI